MCPLGRNYMFEHSLPFWHVGEEDSMNNLKERADFVTELDTIAQDTFTIFPNLS